MIVLKILGILLAVLLLLVLLILALKVTVFFTYAKGEWHGAVQVLFVKLRFPKSPAPETPEAEKKPEKPKKPKKKKQKKKRRQLRSILGYVRYVGRFLRRIPWVVRHVRVHRLRFHVTCGGEDAAGTAMLYGSMCAAVYPLVGYIDTTAKVAPQALDAAVDCDFDLPATEAELELKISLRVFYAVWAAFSALFN